MIFDFGTVLVAGARALLLWLVLLAWGCQHSISDKPNIILINVDDMGWLDTGFMGSQYYHTPHLDSLAALGMVFEQGYAAAANCSPSRASLMTGLWTPRHGVYTVGSSQRGESGHRRLVPVSNTTTLVDSLQILPEILKEQGYTTCHAGKWHLSDQPLERGFDFNFGGAHNGHPNSYFFPYGNVDLDGEQGEHLTDLIMKKVRSFIHSVEGPFFLYYAPYAVHTPIQPVESLLPKYRQQPPWNGQSNAEYATMIENLDRNIGLLWQSLKQRGLFDNTLLIFTSDNGGLYGITYQTPLRAGKGSYYEGGIRVPYFFLWNGHIKPSRNRTTPITNIDLLPTILEAAGIDLSNASYDGLSLLPVLTGTGSLPERSLYWHFPVYLQAYNISDNQNRDSLFRTRPGSVIRAGQWKLHHYNEDDGKELYNLTTDPGEQNNLADAYPEKSSELYRMLDQWRKDVRAPVPTEKNPEFVLKN